MIIDCEQMLIMNQLYDLKAYLYSINMIKIAKELEAIINELESYFLKEQRGEV